MKKTLLVLATLATNLAAFADAQFYDVQMTVKTTTTRTGTPKMVACDCRTDTNGLYRVQSNIKIKGAIWGCNCGTLNKGIPYVSATNAFGCFFWNETTQKPLNVKIAWPVCNRIDKSATKAEVVWTLSSEDGDFYVVCSGFGSLKDVATKDPCTLVTSSFTSLSGGLAGWMTPGAVVTTKATPGTCSWCEKIAGTDEVSSAAKGFAVCSDCSACTEMTGSAAYGTWTIKYNKKASGKLEKSTRVTEAYDFPSYVSAVME